MRDVAQDMSVSCNMLLQTSVLTDGFENSDLGVSKRVCLRLRDVYFKMIVSGGYCTHFCAGCLPLSAEITCEQFMKGDREDPSGQRRGGAPDLCPSLPLTCRPWLKKSMDANKT